MNRFAHDLSFEANEQGQFLAQKAKAFLLSSSEYADVDLHFTADRIVVSFWTPDVLTEESLKVIEGLLSLTAEMRVNVDIPPIATERLKG